MPARVRATERTSRHAMRPAAASSPVATTRDPSPSSTRGVLVVIATSAVAALTAAAAAAAATSCLVLLDGAAQGTYPCEQRRLVVLSSFRHAGKPHSVAAGLATFFPGRGEVGCRS